MADGGAGGGEARNASEGAAGGSSAGAPPAQSSAPKPPTPCKPLPFTDGLGPILLGVLWLIPAFASYTWVSYLAAATSLYTPDLSSPFFILMLDERRSVVLQNVALPIILCAGLARAALPYAAGRDGLALRFWGRQAFWLLAAALMGWLALSASLAIPGLWPDPIQMRPAPPGDFAVEGGLAPVQVTPPDLLWADFALIAMVYAAFMLFAVQILATLAAGWRTLRGPAALAMGVAAVIALGALPDDLRHQWTDLRIALGGQETGQQAAAATPSFEDDAEPRAAPRRDGLYYVFDQITPTAMDFVMIAAIWAVLSAAALKAVGGALRLRWLGDASILAFAAGAALTLANVGFASDGDMTFWLRLAAIACVAPLLALPVMWIASLWPRGAQRGTPAFWALAAAAPSAVALLGTPLAAWASAFPPTTLEFWSMVFNLPNAVLITLVLFAGWYAFQHAMTGRETHRLWSVAHLAVAFGSTAVAVGGVFLITQFGEEAVFGGFAPAECLDQTQLGQFSGPCGSFQIIAVSLLALYFLGDWIIFALGLALARARAWSRFDPTPDGALARSAAAPSAFEGETLFAGEDETAAPEPATGSDAQAAAPRAPVDASAHEENKNAT